MRIDIDPERLKAAAECEAGKCLSVGGLVTEGWRGRTMDDLRDLIDQVRTAESIASLLRRDLQRAQEDIERLRAEVAVLLPCVRLYAEVRDDKIMHVRGDLLHVPRPAREALVALSGLRERLADAGETRKEKG